MFFAEIFPELFTAATFLLLELQLLIVPPSAFNCLLKPFVRSSFE
jgi:hypothetical protein